MDPSLRLNLEGHSNSPTTLKFDCPIPLPRGPITAGPSGYPSSSQYLLAFKYLPSWAVVQNHISMRGRPRIGCAITASNKYKTPWWQFLIGWKSIELNERGRCEDRCLIAAKEKCISFAKERCIMPFLEARIAVREMEVKIKVVGRIVHVASIPLDSKWCHLIGLDKLGECEFRVANYRASQFLGSDAQLQT